MTGVAVIGAGMWAPRLVAAAGRAGLDVVTCFARDRARAERPDVEAVVLATPNDVHAEHAIACAERGRHVFVEKPIADTVEAGKRMRAACAAAGVVLMVGHGFRRLGAARRTRELIDEGRLGRVVLAEANFSLPGKLPPTAWRAQRERSPGGP